MKTNRPLGTRQREAAIAARNANRSAVIGHGEELATDAYEGIDLSVVVTELERPDAESNWRDEHDDDISHATRLVVYARSAGDGDHRRCEAGASPRCTGIGQHLHHRKLRRHGDHREVNLLDVCLFCHHDIHARPAVSYLNGWMTRHADDPEQVPWTPPWRGC